VIFQAGGSEDGRDLAATSADAIFTGHESFEEAQDFLPGRQAARRGGGAAARNEIVVCPGIGGDARRQRCEEARANRRGAERHRSTWRRRSSSSGGPSTTTTSARYEVDAPVPGPRRSRRERLPEPRRADQAGRARRAPDSAGDGAALRDPVVALSSARREDGRGRGRALVPRRGGGRLQRRARRAGRPRRVHRAGGAAPPSSADSSARSTRTRLCAGTSGWRSRPTVTPSPARRPRRLGSPLPANAAASPEGHTRTDSPHGPLETSSCQQGENQ
jgi:hypothetical protein